MSQLLIPKILHRIWLGTEPMSEEFINYGKSWCRKHPKWSIKLWTDKNMIQLQNQKAYDNASHPVLKSDIAKLEILYNFGGIYIDCDLECLKNVEPLLNNIKIFAASETSDIISTAIIGSIPASPVLKDLIDGVPKALKVRKYSTIKYRLGQVYATEKLANRNDIVIFNSELFYPYLYNESSMKDKNSSNSYTIHHWAGSWL